MNNVYSRHAGLTCNARGRSTPDTSRAASMLKHQWTLQRDARVERSIHRAWGRPQLGRYQISIGADGQFILFRKLSTTSFDVRPARSTTGQSCAREPDHVLVEGIDPLKIFSTSPAMHRQRPLQLMSVDRPNSIVGSRCASHPSSCDACLTAWWSLHSMVRLHSTDATVPPLHGPAF